MKKEEIKALIEQAARDSKVANVFMKYSENYYNLIPVAISDRLFLAINEDDFIFDGFRISRLRDVEKVRIKDDLCDRIIQGEGLFLTVSIPKIDLSDWKSVFESLQAIGRNVIVEYETADGVNDNFTIGKIERIYQSCLYIRHFDADGVWQSEPYRIPYTEVTSVTFDSRYVNIFSKYLSALPE